MANFANKIVLQQSRIDFITKIADAAEAGILDNISLQSAHDKLARLASHWEKFEADHEKLLSSKTDVTADDEYFTKGAYTLALKAFDTAHSALYARIDEIESRMPSTGSALANSTAFNLPHHQIQLPTIPMRKFSGRFQDWRQFHDMFVARIGGNPALSNVEKMHYLNECLEGEAARLTANLSITDDSFTTAWDTIVSQYENKRVLISAQLEKLSSIRPADQSSSQQLRSILNTANEALNALKALGSPIEHWDQWLVHHLTKTLDHSTRESWEVSLGNSTEYPSYEDLRTFLTGRVRAREAMECGVSPLQTRYNSAQAKKKSSTSPPAHVHAMQQEAPPAPVELNSAPPTQLQSSESAKQKNSLTESQKCRLCQQDHFIVYCPDFRKLTDTDRFKWTLEHDSCTNCLGRHDLNACGNLKRCTYCKKKHHSMLHHAAQISSNNSTLSLPPPLADNPPQESLSSLSA